MRQASGASCRAGSMEFMISLVAAGLLIRPWTRRRKISIGLMPQQGRPVLPAVTVTLARSRVRDHIGTGAALLRTSRGTGRFTPVVHAGRIGRGRYGAVPGDDGNGCGGGSRAAPAGQA